MLPLLLSLGAASPAPLCTLRGPPAAQARCLLRPVARYGQLEPDRPLPRFLRARVGRPTRISRGVLAR